MCLFKMEREDELLIEVFKVKIKNEIEKLEKEINEQ